MINLMEPNLLVGVVVDEKGRSPPIVDPLQMVRASAEAHSSQPSLPLWLKQLPFVGWETSRGSGAAALGEMNRLQLM